MRDAHLPAVVLIAFAVLCFVRGARGSFKPGFGFAYLNEVRLKGTEKRAYLALGAVLSAIGVWILLR